METRYVDFEGRRYYRNTRGYYRFVPTRKQKREGLKERQLHRDMWASAFGAIPEGHEVHHVDGNPGNNDAINLQPLCHSCHSHKTGRERAGLRMLHGCDASGMPRDPAHPWNEKSPAGESSSTGRPPFFHR